MIPLHTLKIASPCHADWDEMPGDAQVRFCGGCRKNVYNLSEMTQDEAQALVNRLEGRLCVRFYTRADGTLLTRDCPVGLRAVRRKLFKKLSYAAALLLSCVSGLTRWTGTVQAVTVARKHVAVKTPRRPARPAETHSAPQRTMGKVPPPTDRSGKPSVLPTGNRGHYVLGGLAAPPPPPTMGAPLAVPKR